MRQEFRIGLRGAAKRLFLAAAILLTASAPALAQTSNPALSAFNSCALAYNTGKTDEAIAACDKAIALDPGKADAYFIKGSALFGDGKVGSDGKWVVRPGAVEALTAEMRKRPRFATVNRVSVTALNETHGNDRGAFVILPTA